MLHAAREHRFTEKGRSCPVLPAGLPLPLGRRCPNSYQRSSHNTVTPPVRCPLSPPAPMPLEPWQRCPVAAPGFAAPLHSSPGATDQGGRHQTAVLPCGFWARWWFCTSSELSRGSCSCAGSSPPPPAGPETPLPPGAHGSVLSGAPGHGIPLPEHPSPPLPHTCLQLSPHQPSIALSSVNLILPVFSLFLFVRFVF